MPMLPSASSTWSQVPSPGSGPNRSRRTIGARRRRQCRCATADTSTPSAGQPRAASAATSRPGPQPRSIGRARCSGRAATGPRRARPGASGATARSTSTPVVADEPGRGTRRARRRSPRTVTHVAAGRALRLGHGRSRLGRGRADPPGARTSRRRRRTGSRGRPRRRPRASAAVSTSVSSGSSPTRSPAARSAASVRSPVSSREVGTSAIDRRRTRVAQPERPPAAVGGRAERPRRAGARAAAVPRPRPAGPARPAGCPCPAAAPGGRAAGAAASPCAAAIRCPRSGPRWAGVGTPRSAAASSPAAGRPGQVARSARRRRGRRAPRRTAASVSSSAAAARSAAWAGVSGGHSRVLTRPGSGALASTSRPSVARAAARRGAASPQQPRHVPAGPERCRAPSPTPSTGRRRGRGRAPATSRDPPAGGAGPQQQLQRVAERRGRRRPGRAAPSRRATRIGRDVVHRHAPAAQQRRDQRRCRPGRATARPRGPAAPVGRRRGRRAPPATAAASAGSTAASSEPSPSSTATSSAPRRLQPGVHGGAVPAPRLDRPPGRRAPGRRRRCRRWTRCRRRAPASPAGSAASTAGRASASSRHGRTISGSASHVRSSGPARARGGLGAYRSVTSARGPGRRCRSGSRGERAHPLGEPDRGPEPQQRPGPRRVGDDVPHVAGPGAADDHAAPARRSPRRARGARSPTVCGSPGADVDGREPGPGRVRRQREHVGRGDVGDVHEVAALAGRPRAPGAPRPVPARSGRSTRRRRTGCRAASAARRRCGSAATRPRPPVCRAHARDQVLLRGLGRGVGAARVERGVLADQPGHQVAAARAGSAARSARRRGRRGARGPGRTTPCSGQS